MRRLFPIVTGCLLVLAVVLVAQAESSKARITYEWRPFYVPQYYEQYTPDSDPVIALGHAKDNAERGFRVCAWAAGDGELLLTYGGEGEGVEFHLEQGEDVCTSVWLGEGGGIHTNRLDLYLFQRGERPASIERPEIKVRVVK